MIIKFVLLTEYKQYTLKVLILEIFQNHNSGYEKLIESFMI